MPGFFDTASEAPAVAKAPRCGQCGLSRRCKSPKMPWTGEGRRGVLVVAQSPGAEEDQRGTQLIGPSGKKLREVMKRLGWDLDRDCWKTNAVICHPVDEKITGKHVGWCRPNVLLALEELKPHTVLLLGAEAVESVVGVDWRDGLDAIGRWVGWRIPSQRWNAHLCPTWHPAYLLRENDPVLELWFRRHLERALELECRPWPIKLPGFEERVQVLDTEEAARRIDRGFDGPVAFDYETDRLKPDDSDARILSCGLCWSPINAFAFPWHGVAVEAMGRLLRSRVPKIAANLKFEERWTRKVFGHGVHNWAWDTMQAAHVLDNRPGITGVKFQAFVRFGFPPWDSDVAGYIEGEGGNGRNRLHEVPIEKLLRYNALDALMELEIAKQQMEEMKR